MFILKLTADMPESERARWRIIRLDNFTTLEGLIIGADVQIGAVVMQVRPPSPTDIGQVIYTFCPHGIKIVPR